MMSPLTQSIQSSLKEFSIKLFPLDYVSRDDIKTFIYCLHDWLALLTEQPLQGIGYNLTVLAFTKDRMKDCPDHFKGWLDHIVNQPLNGRTLLYRHYLVRYAVSREIFPVAQYPPFYLLAATTMTSPFIVEPLFIRNSFGSIDHDPHPINALRQVKSVIEREIHELAMQERECPCYRSDHGQLTSITLIYTLYLARVMLEHEYKIMPSSSFLTIIQSLSNLLILLTGGLIHGQD